MWLKEPHSILFLQALRGQTICISLRYPQESTLSTPTIGLTPDERRSRATVRGHIIFTFVVLLLLALAWTIQKELLILYVSALFAVVLMPAVNRIKKLKIRGYQPSRAIAIVILILAVILVLAIFFTTGLPPV